MVQPTNLLRLLPRWFAITGLVVAMAIQSVWYALKYRPRRKAFEKRHPTLARLDVPSAARIRRRTTDGRPVLGKPTSMSIRHRLTPVEEDGLETVQREVITIAEQAGWQFEDRPTAMAYETRHPATTATKPGCHDRLTVTTHNASESCETGFVAVNLVAVRSG